MITRTADQVRRRPRTKPLPGEKLRRIQAEILRLRRDFPRMSWDEIGELVGKSPQYAKTVCTKALNSIIAEPAEHVLQLELERLDDLYTEVIAAMRAVHVVVSQGQVVRDVVDDENGNPVIDALTGKPILRRIQDHSPKFAAVDRALKIMERRAKYLGLDKPVDNKPPSTAPEDFAVQLMGALAAIDSTVGGV